MKEMLKSEEKDADTVIARYMFEKFGTLPREVVDMDDYQKGVVFAFLDDIVDAHVKRQKQMERDAKRNRIRRGRR